LAGRSRPLYRLETAKRVLSVDADFLNDEPGSVGNGPGSFSKARKVDNQADAKNDEPPLCG
jgi:hypothetical protein